MDSMIIVLRTATDTEALYAWLRAERDLRGAVQSRPAASTSETMGVGTEIVIALASSGTLGVLARSISAWLVERERQRRADMELEVTNSDGRVVRLTGRRIADVERLLHEVASADILAAASVPRQSDDGA